VGQPLSVPSLTVPSAQTHEVAGEAEDDDDNTTFVTCGRCEARVRDDDARTMASGDLWCEQCFDAYGTPCAACDDYFPVERLYYDRTDAGYCDACYSEHAEQDDDEDGDGDDDDCDGYLHDHDSTVFGVLGICEPDQARLHLGFEIELNTSSRYDAASHFADLAQGLGIVKHDGSIGNGRNGIELVSVPMSLDDIRYFIGLLFPGDVFHHNAFVDATCGMHVHASRAPLTTAQIAKLVRFIHTPHNQAFMERLAGRRLVSSQWASIDHRSESWKAVFVPTNAGSLRIHDWFRYSALNLTNTDTIEFRIFASTTNVARARANVEACAALIAFCAPAECSLTETARFEAFCTFVERRRRDFPHLATLLPTLVASATTTLTAA